MEAWSIEDNGKGVCFSVFVYNKQPGIVIDYTNGDSRLADDGLVQESTEYILNTNSHKFHKPDCAYAGDIKEENRQVYKGSRDILIAQGYSPCGGCKP